jgi:serine phosphatase RsbU (regulator of sigma subunit)
VPGTKKQGKDEECGEPVLLMVVDDDEDNLTSLERRLSGDYRVLACRSGDEAVREFRNCTERIYGVIMDIRMPGISGVEAAQLIRNQDPHVPIIFRTGFSEQYPEHKILEKYEGTVDYVRKGQRAHDFYLEKAIQRGIKCYKALFKLQDLHQKLQDYEAKLNKMVEELVAHEENLQTAVEFQSSLLGHTEHRDGLALAAAMHFCEEMGGDFYDVFNVDDGRMGIILADVCGHGIPAALITGMLKAQVQALGRLDDPTGLMRQVNDRLYPLLSSQQKFVTGVYATIDFENGEVIYAGAGHNPVAVLSSDGQIHLHHSTGMPIGAAEDINIGSAGFELQEGESMWLYTDGVFELANPEGRRYGRDRLIEAIGELKSPDLQNWVDSVLKRCREYAGSCPVRDDMSIIAVRPM